MEIVYGRPFTGKKLEQIMTFLQVQGIHYDNNIDFTVAIIVDNEIIATGSRAGNVLKCIASLASYQGEGLAAKVLTELINDAYQEALYHLFLYTKQENERYFSQLGFYKIAVAKGVLFMENKKQGIVHHLQELKTKAEEKGTFSGPVGAIVVNCNPVTKGHLYLIERAAHACGLLYILLVSEDKSIIPAQDRYQLLEEAIRPMQNVVLGQTGSYLISSVTFPTYFLKDDADVSQINCQMDIEIFVSYFAPILGITKRFVGTEPNCLVTAAYNRTLLAELPKHQITIEVIDRLDQDGAIISASRVRKLWQEGKYQDLKSMVPAHVYQYLCGKEWENGTK